MEDTYLVIARFSMDDVVIECKRDLEVAKQLAAVIADEPETLRGEVGESMAAWFANTKAKARPEDLTQVGILRLLGGVVSASWVMFYDVE
jgi:hypothetical protein